MKTAVARLLESQSAIPAVAGKLPFLQEIQSSPFWDDVNILDLEAIRNNLRDLVQFIERHRRANVITDIEDQIGDGTIIDLPGTSVGVDVDRVRDEAMVFLRKHENDAVLHKLRFNEALTPEDLDALEAIFLLRELEAADLDELFASCDPAERLLFRFFLMTGLREQEVMYCTWRDINFNASTISVHHKPQCGWSPKAYKEREVPVPAALLNELREAKEKSTSPLLFPTSSGQPDTHMLRILNADGRTRWPEPC
jgi:type I site-specific restriction endonuclease